MLRRRLCASRHLRRFRSRDDVANRRSLENVGAMESEAARLRAEVESIEAERRATRARQLLGDGGATYGQSTALRADDLPARLHAVVGLDVTLEQAQELCRACHPQSDRATLSHDDLASEAFDKVLRSLSASHARARQQERLEEMRRSRQVTQEQQTKREAALRTYGDRSLRVRAVGALVYVLPLIDGLLTGFAYVGPVPDLDPYLEALTIPGGLLRSYPLGPLFLFTAVYASGFIPALPRLLRFSCQQAALLDLTANTVALCAAWASQADGGRVDTVALELAKTTLIMLLAAVAYATGCTVLDADADGIPLISASSKRGLED